MNQPVYIFYIQFEEEHFVLRSRAQHLEHCDLLEDEEDDYVENSRDVGVNHRSILLDLQYFDMCSGALLPDVMHDVLEGALQYEVSPPVLHQRKAIFLCIRSQ